LPTKFQQNAAAGVAGLLSSAPARLFSIAGISRALGYSTHSVTRALAALKGEQRATTVQTGRYTQWQALTDRPKW
jgi:hypothetical protein